MPPPPPPSTVSRTSKYSMKRKLRNTHSHHLSLGSGDLLLPDNDSDSPAAACDRDSASPKEQDRFLPIANVSRIMKRSLPANAKISMDAKEVVQECASEFISFITGEASDKCQREKRKTVNGDDLLWAMTTLGFDSYVAPLKAYLNRYREAEGDKSRAGSAARHGEPTTSSNDQKLGSTTAVADFFSSNTVPTIASSARIPGGFGIPGEFFLLGPSSAAVEGWEQLK